MPLPDIFDAHFSPPEVLHGSRNIQVPEQMLQNLPVTWEKIHKINFTNYNQGHAKVTAQQMTREMCQITLSISFLSFKHALGNPVAVPFVFH